MGMLAVDVDGPVLLDAKRAGNRFGPRAASVPGGTADETGRAARIRMR
jgi:hypothetical protein